MNSYQAKSRLKKNVLALKSPKFKIGDTVEVNRGKRRGHVGEIVDITEEIENSYEMQIRARNMDVAYLTYWALHVTFNDSDVPESFREGSLRLPTEVSDEDVQNAMNKLLETFEELIA